MLPDGVERSEMWSKQLFAADVVVSASQPGLLGTVFRLSGDHGSDSEDCSDDQHDGDDGVQAAQVFWLNATGPTDFCRQKHEPVRAHIADLGLVDRPFRHSEAVVRAGSCPMGQTGKVVDISILVDLEVHEADGNITVHEGIDSKMIRRVTPFATGDVVVKGSWVGRVVGLEENVTVEFEDGRKCIVLEADTKRLVPKLAVGEIEAYYPGRTVRAPRAKTLRDATWLAGCWKSGLRKVEATVVHVETAAVMVEWMQHRDDIISRKKRSKRVPEEKQKPQGLKAMLPFGYAEWNLGRRCMLGTSVARIVNIATKVDVLWQNGDMSCGIRSCELDFAPVSGENHLWPRQYVTDRGAGGDGQQGKVEPARFGLVKRIDSEQRTAVVEWTKAGVPDEEEVVSVYEIGGHVVGDLGDLLFQPAPRSERQQQQQPWVGFIRLFTVEGAYEVIWQDGSTSTVKPQDVEIQGYKHDDDDELLDVSASGAAGTEQDKQQQQQQQAPVDEGCQIFEQFGIAKNAVDHHFLSESGTPGNQRAWAQRVQKEWSVLERHLPAAAVYVRVYEDRMDLLTAVIVGPDETPYQDGLYVFEMHLPPEYPHHPPQVHYRSGGLRVNPNLYEDGTVCLSLLNTWPGKESEMWNPEASNILQVLLSLQGLVLIQKPFFNEPGFDRERSTSEGERKSTIYNESCFLLCCTSMLYLLRRPPSHFEALVTHHFRRVGPKICRTCKAYIGGAKVGCLPPDPEPPITSGSSSIPAAALNSQGFRLALHKLVIKLEAAFGELQKLEN